MTGERPPAGLITGIKRAKGNLNSLYLGVNDLHSVHVDECARVTQSESTLVPDTSWNMFANGSSSRLLRGRKHVQLGVEQF